MNKVILMGRLTKNPEIKYAGKDNDMAVARYTLAVNMQIPLHRITDSASNGSVFPVVTEHFSASSDHAFL